MPGRFFIGLSRRARFIMPRAPVPVPAPDAAARVATSLSILFRNFRK